MAVKIYGPFLSASSARRFLFGPSEEAPPPAYAEDPPIGMVEVVHADGKSCWYTRREVPANGYIRFHKKRT